MGTFIKEQYGDLVYTIGFTGYEGHYGMVGRKKKLKTPKKNTLELVLGLSEYDNFLLPLAGLDLSDYRSRPLGNAYMTTPINHVMDAVIFNRTVSKPRLDNNLYLSVYPDNKWIKPIPAEGEIEIDLDLRTMKVDTVR